MLGYVGLLNSQEGKRKESIFMIIVLFYFTLICVFRHPFLRCTVGEFQLIIMKIPETTKGKE